MRRYGLPPLPTDEEIFGKGAKFRIPELEVWQRLLAPQSRMPCPASADRCRGAGEDRHDRAVL